MESNLSDAHKNIQIYKDKSKILDTENRQLKQEITMEKNKFTTCLQNFNQQHDEYNVLNDNYNRLKYVSSITDNQLTVVEEYLAKEREVNKAKEDKIIQLNAEKSQQDDRINQLEMNLRQVIEKKEYAESMVSKLRKELGIEMENVKKLEEKLNDQHQNMLERVTKLHSTQEHMEALQMVNRNNLQQNEKNERDILMLKEENTRILTDLFHAKEALKETQKNLEGKLSLIHI